MKSFAFLTLLLFVSSSFGQVTFQFHQIGTMNGPYFIEVADMDGDNDDDVVVAGLHSDKIVWFENPNWTEHTIVTSWTDPYISVGDMDNDGDNDVVASSWPNDIVVWFENPGWAQQIIDINFNGAAGLYAIDMDGDDTTDVVAVGSYANQIVWYDGPNWNKNTIDGTVINNPPPYPDNVYVFDIDEDTDLDVFNTTWDPGSYATGSIIFYENLNDTAWNKTTIDGNSGYVLSIDMGDLDNDNINELAASLYGLDRVVMYDYPSWTRSNIDPSFNNAVGVGIGDINKDGNLDIVASGQNTSNPLRWYEGPSWIMHPIYQTSTSFHDLAVTDLDNDSDLDIPISNISDDRVLWFENLLPPDTIHVPGDVATIQAAIDSATNGNIVLVDTGTYQENINFKGKAITVASYFYIDGDTSHIDNTIIDGSNHSHPDSGSVVYFITGEDTNSVLCGFTITGGTGTIDSPNNWRNGGGIYATNSSPHIKNNIIESNVITYNNDSYGGGIYALYLNNNFIIENNIIRNNDIISSSVTDYSLGAGIYTAANGTEKIQITGNKILNNAISAPVGYGCGITPANVGNATYIITNNFISGNVINAPSGGSGGIDVFNHLPFFRKNVTHNNSAPMGGGILIEFTSDESIGGKRGNVKNIYKINDHLKTAKLFVENLSNNTVVGNSATISGGGIKVVGSMIPTLMNFIAWNNTAPTGAQISGTAIVEYSDVEGGHTGTGNIDSDPLFADTLFHLSGGSPCINSGNPDPAYNDPDDSRNDMGAYGGPIVPGLFRDNNKKNIPNDFHLLQNYPNPFNPSTTIEFSIPKTEHVTLIIYNLLGQEVTTLVSDKLTPGEYKYTWDASHLASGVYIYKIQTDNGFTKTKKLLLIK